MPRILRIFMSLLILTLFYSFTPIEIAEEKVSLKKGDEKVFKLDFSADTKIQVANQKVVDYVFIPQRKEISLKALDSGNSSVTIRDLKGEPKLKIFVEVTK